ncbi:MAG: hypothetical protein AB8G22_14830, partial [Saprospiraceae bacterium]
EGAIFDNKIIASKRPFVDWVVKPSATFEPTDPAAIANTVIKALNDPLPPTELIFKNKINQIIDLAYV